MSNSRIRKGDLVRFKLGTRSVQGEVKEDRGPIGVRGRHLRSNYPPTNSKRCPALRRTDWRASPTKSENGPSRRAEADSTL
jgi:hypothetical protein